MCLILFAYKAVPGVSLIVAANRDEWFSRPAAPADFWDDGPKVLAGRDLQAGGTWLGLTTTGRFSALTNYRNSSEKRADAPSRGDLVRSFLTGRESARTFLSRLAERAGAYNGFNLLAGDVSRLYCFSTQDHSLVEVAAGIHGLSNHLLDTPWPKVKLGCDTLNALDHCKDPDTIIETLLNTLADQRRAPITELPKTGVTLQLEKTLSPPFIMGDHYGTRNSMVVIVSASGEVFVHEKRFGSQARFAGETARAFKIR